MEEEEEEEEDREDEVSTGEEAVREGVMGKESIEENGKSNKGVTCKSDTRKTEVLGSKKKMKQICCNKLNKKSKILTTYKRDMVLPQKRLILNNHVQKMF